MKVKDLIKYLGQFDPNAECFVLKENIDEELVAAEPEFHPLDRTMINLLGPIQGAKEGDLMV